MSKEIDNTQERRERNALVGGLVGFSYSLWSLTNLQFENDAYRAVVVTTTLFDLINVYVPIGVILGVAAGSNGI